MCRYGILMKAVEFINVTFSYEGSGAAVLDTASFCAEYNQLTVLAGFSGAGKSTVLSLIAGIIPNEVSGNMCGEILIAGENVRGKQLRGLCRKVGIVLQNAELQIIHPYVEDEIAFGCENCNFSPALIEECVLYSCSTMKLNPAWETGTLSGGQKQRLITAAVLAMKQKIIVLDEPLANLDRDGTLLLMTELRKLAECGYAVLIVEHRLDMVLPFVDTVWDIRSGKLFRVENKMEYLKSHAGCITDTCVQKTTDDVLFSLEHVGLTAAKRQILKDITFSIRKGERVLLLGENGCGKTTLLRLLARLSMPTKGKIIQYLDTSFGQNRKGSRRWFSEVGVVYQNPANQLFMPTVMQEIAYGAESEQYAREIMHLFRVEHLAERHPQSLSEGQKRRVTIASVAASNPRVFLLDEPTVGQDYSGLQEMISILNRLHEENGNTMITVTHDLRCAEAVCDHAVYIINGFVAEEGGKELVRRYFTKDDIRH